MKGKQRYLLTPTLRTDINRITASNDSEERGRGSSARRGTHGSADALGGAIELLLHSFLEEIDSELQVKVLFLQFSDLLEKKHRWVIESKV